MGAMITAIRNAPIEPGMPTPRILVVAPPRIQKAMGTIAPRFEGAGEKAVGLAAACEREAAESSCLFFDAGSVTESSKVDGVHLDEDHPQTLGKALANVIEMALALKPT